MQMVRRRLRTLALLITCAVPIPWAAACASGEAPPPAPRSTERADIFLTPDTELIRGLVPRNTTLETLLRSHGLAAEAVQGVIAAARTAFDPRRLRASQPFVLLRTIEGELRRFEYEVDSDSFLRVDRERPDAALAAALVPIPKTREEVVAGGSIDDVTPSLFQAMEAAGEGPDLSIAMAQIFSGEIDFNTELRQGDRFGVVFEKFTREGRPSTYGEILAAEFHNDGRVVRAISFTPPGGKPGYYDERGRSLRRFFLRSPLKFEPRITSGFSRRRFHPVLHTYRAHLGIDYGAPTGAPVVAVANGTVISATYDRANGRMVRLKHAGGYETYYLHLSAFGAGIRAGARVSQGQVIGRVGSTGLATAAHLDYRLRKNGVFVNPLTEHRRMPPGDPVPAAALAAFEEARDRALELLDDAMERADSVPEVVATAAH
jgi:murein DD-endopeptidase MepM/ murein hydrolase activator NlpD